MTDEVCSVDEFADRAKRAVALALRDQFLGELGDKSAFDMTKESYRRYSAALEAAHKAGVEKILQRTYDQIRRERTPEWKAAVDLHVEEAAKVLGERADVQAFQTFTQPGLRLDRDAVAAKFPELADRLPKNMLKAKGLDPIEAADLAGYPNAARMVADLADLQTAIEATGSKGIADFLAKRARALATSAARELLGFDTSPEGMAQAAQEAAALPEVTALLDARLAMLREQLGRPLTKTDVQGDAARLFGQMRVGDAASPKTFVGGMRSTGRKLQHALEKGDWEAAFKYGNQQFLNHLQYKLSLDLAKELAKADKTLRVVAKKPINTGMDQAARNILRWLARDMGYNVRTQGYEGVDEALQGTTLDSYMDDLRAKGYTPVHVDAPHLPLKDQTVEQFRGVRDMVESIATLGRWEKRVWRAGREAEILSVAAEVRENANAIGRPFPIGEMHLQEDRMSKSLALGDRAQVAGRLLGSAVSRPEIPLFWLDGETNGPLMQHIVNELQDGKYTKADLIKQIGEGFRDFVAKQPEGWEKTLADDVNIPELTYSVDKNGAPVQWLRNRGNVIMMATHLGTESNLSKLLEGFGWDEETVRHVADRTLTEADWKYVQHILDTNEALVPRIRDLYRATVGLAMESIPALPIPTPFGVLPGGYRHITYDWNSIGEFQDEDGNPVNVRDPTALGEKSMFGPQYRSATPPNGYTLARTKFSAPFNLDHGILHREIEAVVHDLAYRKALIQSAKLFRDPTIRQAIRESLGPEYLSSYNRWLTDIARQASYDQATLSAMASMVRGIRRRFTMVQIGYNVATVLKHGGIAASHIDGAVGAANFARATSDLAKSQELADWVDENIGEVRTAMTNVDRDVNEMLSEVFREQGFVDAFRFHAFTAFAVVKRFEAKGTALAAYRLAQDAGASHEDAVAAANKAVRDTQGAGSPVDLPALWRGDSSFWSEIGKLSNVFTGFENTSTNRMWTMIRRTPRMIKGFKDQGWAGGKRDFISNLGDLRSYFLVTALYAAAFDSVTQGKGDDFLSIWAEDMLKGLLGGSVPLGNTLADFPRAIASRGKNFGSAGVVQEILGETLGSVLDGIDAATGNTSKVPDRWVQHAIETAGYVGSLPLKPFAKAGQWLWDETQGHVTDKSPLEIPRGLLFGPTTEEAKKTPTRSRSRGHSR